MIRVFISHSHKDNDLARKVANALQKNGLEVWYAQDILPGDNWAQKVSEALEQSQAMVVLITPEALESPWVRSEIEYALGKKVFRGRLVSVIVGRLEDIPTEDFPWILRHLTVIELASPEKEDEGIRQIAEALCEAS